MKSPLIIHQELLGSYQDYLSKQFKSKNSVVTNGRNGLYKSKSVTFQPPFLEFLFNYEKSGRNLAEAYSINELLPFFENDADALEGYRKLIGSGLVPYEIYEHQWSMLRETILNGKHAIITTGTGSGKTESFMLPLIAYLSKQLRGQEQTYNTNNQYRRLDNGVYQRRIADKADNFTYLRTGEYRPAAMKAILLFPMNALVEDQLKRIRNAFSTPAVLDVLDNDFGGSRIFYGKYNGLTPGTGDYNSTQLKSFYEKLSINEKAVREYADSEPEKNRYEDALNYFGREISENGSRLTGEMLNRYDMQQHPPDILITNFSMLNVMLTRSVEQSIWEKTAMWLQQEGTVFHVVLDELHLYRGSAGTEIAYTISALLERLGIADKPEKVRFLASSASLDTNNALDEVKSFIGGFFNVSAASVLNQFHLEEGKTICPQEGNDLALEKIKNLFAKLSREENPVLEDTVLKEICDSSFISDLCDWYRSNNGARNRPCSIEELARYLLQKFALTSNTDQEVCNIYSARPNLNSDEYHVLNGFFLFRDLIDRKKLAHNIPRIRMHMFYNNFEGLWGSTKVGANNTVEYGRLFSHPKKIDQDGSKVYPLFYCEKCETSFIGGYKDVNAQWVQAVDGVGLPGAAGANNTFLRRRITPTEIGLNSDSHRAVSADTNFLSYKDFAVFWPEGQEPGQKYIKHIPETKPRDKIAENIYDPTPPNPRVRANVFGYWVKAFFNPNTGEIRLPYNQQASCPDGFINGRLYIAIEKGNDDGYYQNGNLHPSIREEIAQPDPEAAKALSQCCPACATKKKLSSIVRGYRTGFNRTNQLFASGLLRALKKYSPSTISQPKIVSFSDSRDEAAKVSAGVEAQHFSDIVTNYLLCELNRIEYSYKEKMDILRELIMGTILESSIPQHESLILNSFEQYQRLADPNQILQLPAQIGLDAGVIPTLFAVLQNYGKSVRVSDAHAVNTVVGEFMYGKPITGLFKYLLEKGIDPRGVYNVTPELKIPGGGGPVKWFEPINFNSGNVYSLIGGDNQAHTYYGSILRYLKAMCLSMMFANSIYDIETMGLGKLVPCFQRPSAFPQQHWDSFIYGLVKLLGWKNKYLPRLIDLKRRGFDESPINVAQNLPKDVENYLAKFETLNHILIDRGSVLELFPGNRVCLDFSDDTCPVQVSPLQLDDLVLRCQQCMQVYSRKVSHCLNCGNDNQANFFNVPVHEVRTSSFTGSHIHNLQEVNRLHCEELSGQTDEPFERQRHFLGLIKNEKLLKKAQEIDLLSVTTTLEVGVDIGSLQGMLMANMPPQRFNYQQRVGRVGRRGQAFSFAVTLCRSKSHDAHYFQHPDEITGAPSPTPFLNVEQPDIMKRVLNKYFLAVFFRRLAEYMNVARPQSPQDRDWNKLFAVGDVNGEFGKILYLKADPYQDKDGNTVENPLSYLVLLDQFFNDNQQELEGNYNNLLKSLRRDGQLFNDAFLAYWNYIRSVLLHTASSPDVSVNSSLGQVLMERGHLPSYGMPSKIAYFYNKYPLGQAGKYIGEDSVPPSMDRTLDVAIFDYAPGSLKLKDKNEYTVKAIVPDVKQVRTWGNAYWQDDGSYLRSQMAVYTCDAQGCKHFKLVNVDNADQGPITCDSCGNQTLMHNGIRAIEPKNFSIGLNSNDADEDANISSNNRLAISGLSTIKWEPHNAELGNILKSYSTSDPVNFIYKINKGKGGSIQMGERSILDDTNNGRIRGLYLNGPNAQPYWLYTRKNTDTLSFVAHDFFTAKFDLTLDANPQRSLELKAVFLSAATILQRCFADILDIDPREIEFVNPEATQIVVGDQEFKTLLLTFYDSHDNGSGYVRRIQEELTQAGSLLNYISQSDFFKNALTTDSHKATCLSGSCYKCIRTYDNSSLHGLLDWRVGLDLISLMSDSNFQVAFEEFENYMLNIAGHNRYQANTVEDNDQNKGVVLSDLNGNSLFLVTHPLLRFDSSTYMAVNVGVQLLSFYGLKLTC
jgi:DEAD/DEAH box helicase domain-containing protein